MPDRCTIDLDEEDGDSEYCGHDREYDMLIVAVRVTTFQKMKMAMGMMTDRTPALILMMMIMMMMMMNMIMMMVVMMMVVMVVMMVMMMTMMMMVVRRMMTVMMIMMMMTMMTAGLRAQET